MMLEVRAISRHKATQKIAISPYSPFFDLAHDSGPIYETEDEHLVTVELWDIGIVRKISSNNKK